MKGAIIKSFSVFFTIVIMTFSLARPSFAEEFLPPYPAIENSGDSYVRIEWTMDDNASIEDIIGFRIYRADIDENSSSTLMVGSLQRSYNDTYVVNGKRYDYRISALYTIDMIERSSFTVSAIPGTVPYPPVNITAEHISGGILIGWSLPDNNGGFPPDRTLIQRKNVNCKFDLVGTVRDNDTYFLDSSIDPEKEYTYRLITINQKGPSDPSEEVLIAPVYKPPESPFDARGTTRYLFIEIKWQAPRYDGGIPITGYIIQRSSNVSSALKEFNIGPDNNSYNDTLVDINTVYTYRIIAVNMAGRSLPSDPITVVIFPEYAGEISDGNGSRYKDQMGAWMLSGSIFIGIVLVIMAIIIYLKMTDQVDEEDELEDDVRPPAPPVITF